MLLITPCLSVIDLRDNSLGFFGGCVQGSLPLSLRETVSKGFSASVFFFYLSYIF